MPGKHLTAFLGSTLFVLLAMGPGASATNYRAPVAEWDPVTWQVSIVDMAYEPGVLKIKTGDTVVWTNNDTTAHTVDSDHNDGQPAGPLNSGTLLPYETYSYTFDTARANKYHCDFHPNMQARILVSANGKP